MSLLDCYAGNNKAIIAPVSLRGQSCPNWMTGGVAIDSFSWHCNIQSPERLVVALKTMRRRKSETEAVLPLWYWQSRQPVLDPCMYLPVAVCIIFRISGADGFHKNTVDTTECSLGFGFRHGAEYGYAYVNRRVSR